jgi:predicted homoserine dehydrogenase-like protein
VGIKKQKISEVFLLELGYDAHPARQQYMNYFKIGDEPLYFFFTPLVDSVTIPVNDNLGIFYDATVSPMGTPSYNVITVAKRDLKAGICWIVPAFYVLWLIKADQVVIRSI